MSSKLRKATTCLVKEIEHQNILDNLGMFPRDTLKCILNGVKNALAEPVLNCEVGTAEEQYARFKKWCEGEFYKRQMNPLTGEPCKSCPCYSVSANGADGCNYLRWAQMPYEEAK